MKGEGDGERNKIFAEAFGRDPEFFAFYRAMQAYETALIGGDTSLILSPDSEFFIFPKNLKNSLSGDNINDVSPPIKAVSYACIDL